MSVASAPLSEFSKLTAQVLEEVVPFSGEGDLSHVRPSQFTLNSPQGAVHENELRTAYCAQGSEDGRSVREAVERDFATIVGFTDVAARLGMRISRLTFRISDRCGEGGAGMGF